MAEPPVVTVLPALPEAEPAPTLSEDALVVTVSNRAAGEGTLVTFASPSAPVDPPAKAQGIMFRRNGQAGPARSIVLLPVRGSVAPIGLPVAAGSALDIPYDGGLLEQDRAAGPVAVADRTRAAVRGDKADAARTAAARPDADRVPRPAPPQDDVPSATSGGWSAGPGNGGGMMLVAAMMAALALAAPRLGRRLRLELPSLHRLLIATTLERPG